MINRGLVIKAMNDLDKHLNRRRDFTGSLENMSTMISRGKAAAIASTSC